MSENKLTLSQPQSDVRNQNLPWALIGELPFSLAECGVTDPLNSADLQAWPVDNPKPLHKWLKKQWELPLLVLVLPADADDQTELIRYLREDLKNTKTRLICFAGDHVRKQLLPQLWSWRIQHLHSLTDLEVDVLTSLMHQEWQEYAACEAQRSGRNSELELLTFLARMNREASFGQQQQSELSVLLCSILHAEVFLYSGNDGQLKGIYPESQSLSVDWQSLATTALAATIRPEQPLLLQLQKDLPLHQLASDTCHTEITASVIFPLRCYDQPRAYFIAFLTEDAVTRLDVSRMSLLEKTMEQVRTQQERELSESRLKAQYERLQNTLSKLHQTQEQLYHSEKLSAVGQLAAGIAHEINNPVSFIMSNFEPLDEYIHTMSRMLQLHEQFTSAIVQGDESIGNQLRQQISQEREAADFEFMMEDIYSLVNDSRTGLKRVSEIVTNLRTFSRRDTLETADTDLSECITSALNLMKYQLNSGIETEVDIPQQAIIEGNGGLLGQVLVNLIQNAVHAMDGIGKLAIRLSREEEQWQLEIEDSGSGIPEEIQNKIFDPFFTTKEIGKGTGLGLSTVYSIIQRHKGNIELSSKPGCTCFRITLPAKDLQ